MNNELTLGLVEPEVFVGHREVPRGQVLSLR